MPRHNSHFRILEFVEDYIQLYGRAPTLDEMMHASGKSRGAVQNSLKWLATEGYIERQGRKARAIRVLRSITHKTGIPVWGTIAAGYLTEVFADTRETLPLFSPILKPGDFALRVEGDSMIGDYIPDGAFVILRPLADPSTLKDGEIVAAWVEGRGVTLKHLYRYPTHISLIASNPNYPPITLDPDVCDVKIQGVLLWVFQGRGF